MNDFALPSINILIHDGNGRSMLGLNNAPSYHNRNVGDMMIINAMDINYLIRFLNDANIITSNATLGASIYK